MKKIFGISVIVFLCAGETCMATSLVPEERADQTASVVKMEEAKTRPNDAEPAVERLADDAGLTLLDQRVGEGIRFLFDADYSAAENNEQ